MQKINLKKTTKEQMLNMLETAYEANESATAELERTAAQIHAQQEEIAVLRAKLTDTDAALGRANAELTYSVAEKNALRNDVTKMVNRAAFECGRADYAESHPWGNLWAWLKRKMVRHE